jgi:hypothetical protein
VEKAHNLTMSSFGIVLAVIELILACVIIYFSINFSIMISGLYPVYPTEMMQPLGYLVALLNATRALLLLGGIYVLVHAIKRLIDNIFKVYLASKH